MNFENTKSTTSIDQIKVRGPAFVPAALLFCCLPGRGEVNASAAGIRRETPKDPPLRVRGWRWAFRPCEGHECPKALRLSPPCSRHLLRAPEPRDYNSKRATITAGGTHSVQNRRRAGRESFDAHSHLASSASETSSAFSGSNKPSRDGRNGDVPWVSRYHCSSISTVGAWPTM